MCNKAFYVSVFDDCIILSIFLLQDTEVILWDVVSETGIARFSGHKGVVTSVLFINSKNCIISSSKDTFVKFWDIETKHCFKTLGGHQMEVRKYRFIYKTALTGFNAF